MPDTSLLSPFIVRLGGGLMLDKDAFTLPPGSATQLQNLSTGSPSTTPHRLAARQVLSSGYMSIRIKLLSRRAR